MDQQSALPDDLRQKLRSTAAMLHEKHVKPVVAALLDSGAGDAKLCDLLTKLQTQVPDELDPDGQPNAWAKGNPVSPIVEIEMNFIVYFYGISKLVAVALAGFNETSQIVRQATYSHWQKLRQAVDSGSETPVFRFRIEDYTTNLMVIAIVNRLWPYALNQLMAWAVLHEIAHHYLGHLRPSQVARRNPGNELEGTGISRQLEVEADAWAFSKMQEFGFSMEALAMFFAFESVVEDVLTRLGRGAKPTHPTFAERRRAIEAFPAVDQPPPANLRLFVTAVETTNPNTSEPQIVVMEIVIPGEHRTKQALSLAVVFVSDDEIPMFSPMEYRGNSIYLYSREPGFRSVHVIENKNAYHSPVIIRVIDESTGREQVSRGSIVQLQLSLFDWHTKVGPASVNHVLNLDTMSDLRRFLGQLVTDERARRAFEAVVLQSLEAMADVLLSYGKGEISRLQLEQVAARIDSERQRRLESIVGRDVLDALNKRMMADPFYAWSMSQMERLNIR